MSNLSELSRTYMEFIEDIRSGERAFVDDVGRLLAPLTQLHSDVTLVERTKVERRWVESATFTLCLEWNSVEAWPKMKLEVLSETKLFDPVCLRYCDLPTFNRDALFADPAAELSRVWEEGCTNVINWIGSDEVRNRLGVLAILKEVAGQARSVLQPLPGAWVKNGQISGLAPNSDFPIYVEWNDQDAKTNKKISWDILYHYDNRSDRPAGLQLICYEGASVPHLLQSYPAIATYVHHPVLAAWPERLEAVVAGRETAREAADAVLRDTAKIYGAYRERLDGQTR